MIDCILDCSKDKCLFNYHNKKKHIFKCRLSKMEQVEYCPVLRRVNK